MLIMVKKLFTVDLACSVEEEIVMKSPVGMEEIEPESSSEDSY